MKLIIGGSYQGKTDYARREFGVDPEDIYICSEDSPADTECRCIAHIERYVLYCMRRNMRPELPERADSVFICDDISSGIVPAEAEMRRWREETGILLRGLAERAESVVRIFCGMAQVLK